jgi:uncharacterized protein (TIGR03435 family)
MRLMMQSLLAERFGFVAHFENRDMPVFALTLIKQAQRGQNCGLTPMVLPATLRAAPTASPKSATFTL